MSIDYVQSWLFHQLLPPQKAGFQSSLACPLSGWALFEHSGPKMSSLDIEPLYSTLCPSNTSTRLTSKIHLNMFQCNVWGDVRLGAITYVQGCIVSGWIVAPCFFIVSRHLMMYGLKRICTCMFICWGGGRRRRISSFWFLLAAFQLLRGRLNTRGGHV